MEFATFRLKSPISGGDQTYANAQMTGAIVLACHQVDAIEKIFFGDEEIPLTADIDELLQLLSVA